MTAVNESDSHPRGEVAPSGRARARDALWRHRWFALAVVALAALGAGEGLRLALGPEVVVDRATRGALVESVVATGNILTPYRAQIGSQITGTVAEVLVEEGQKVIKDQPLIRLEDTELKAAVVQAQGALAEAEARMKQLRELSLPTAQQNLAQLQADLVDAEKTYDRKNTLVKSGAETQANLDDARKSLDVARAQVAAAQLAVYTSSPGGSDYVMAQTQVNQARANLETARARLGYALIAAPRNGVLMSRNVEKGAVAQPGTALLVLAPEGVTQVQLAIDERNLGKIALGAKALVSADAYPDQRFDAVVSYINPGVDISRGSVEVKLDVPQPPPYLLQDMTVSADVEYARKDDALVLPARSVRDALSAAPWVMIVRGGRAAKQPVKLGLRGPAQFEIVDGLAAGDLAIPMASGVLTGQRLRPVTP